MEELLQSLTLQEFSDFEVLIIEDGSSLTSDKIAEKYSSLLNLTYFFKPNSGPGPSRNFGFQKAKGTFFVIFDSDCLVPPHYLKEVDAFLEHTKTDAFGGPDRGHSDFSSLQQAMAYTMSSFLTTGGIRGGKATNFQPRSFNMGLSREAFEKTGGFHFDRFAEDIELSLRMKELGLHVHLIPNAYVYHKRRTTLHQFYRQVSNFGRGRVLVGKRHRNAIKFTHWIPALFTLGLFGIIPLFFFSKTLGLLLVSLYALYLLAIAALALANSGSLRVGLLAIPSAFVQLTGYGIGFLEAKFEGKGR